LGAKIQNVFDICKCFSFFSQKWSKTDLQLESQKSKVESQKSKVDKGRDGIAD